MKNVKSYLIPALMVVPFLTMVSCKSDKAEQSSKAKFYLTDAPGNFIEVNVEILEIEITTDGGEYTVTATYDSVTVTKTNVSVTTGQLTTVDTLQF
ncbi:MAG: hypothetical protein ACJAZ3_001032 [Sphingobacteriales bacterium]|jgi:hypothetical protein